MDVAFKYSFIGT